MAVFSPLPPKPKPRVVKTRGTASSSSVEVVLDVLDGRVVCAAARLDELDDISTPWSSSGTKELAALIELQAPTTTSAKTSSTRSGRDDATMAPT